MRLRFLAVPSILLLSGLVAGCSSSSSTGGTGGTGGTGSNPGPEGGSCSLTASSTLSFTKVVKDASSDPQCPDLTVADLNAGDAGALSMCKTTFDLGICGVSFSCSGNDSNGNAISGSGSSTVSGSTGTISALITSTPDGGNSTQCSYELTFSVQ